MIAIYIVCGLGIGFSLGMMAAAVLVDRRTKKRRRELARFIGARGAGKTGCSTINPYCYIDQEEEEENEK